MSTNKAERMPDISFVFIVLNGMPFVECAINAVYEHAHEIIVVEGAVEQCRFMANSDGSSIDGTVELMKNINDPAAKIRLLQGKWSEKLEMHNKALEYVTGDYVWLVDSDEVYKGEDIDRIKTMLSLDPSIVRVDFIPDNFWKGFDYIFFSDKFFEERHHYRRVFKHIAGMQFSSHRPPTVNCAAGRVVTGYETREMGVYPYHYSYVHWGQVCQKIELYRRYGWGNQWEVDLNEWYRDFYLKWTPENRETLESQYPVWTGDAASRTRLFTGKHPKAVQKLVQNFSAQGDFSFLSVSEDAACDIIGAIEQQKKVLIAWKNIALDRPLIRRRDLILEKVKNGEPFWNIHVALAFLASTLQPERYLEVGVRTGGSLVQVLHNGPPKIAIAVDIWKKSYADIPNTFRFTRRQFEEYRRRTGNRAEIRYMRKDSHAALKRLIRSAYLFDLITVDGDHTFEGAWEDLEDAVKLLSERGAIVLDDIVHPAHAYLLTLVYRLKHKYPFLSVIINTQQDNGCAVFLKGIDPEDLFIRARNMNRNRVRIAEDLTTGEDLTRISSQSVFSRRLGELFQEIMPRRIIETGTFHGEGTTKIIASYLQGSGMQNTLFYSIECNTDNLKRARINISREGLGSFVSFIHGLSVPRALLPSPELIQEKFVNAFTEEGIFIDHQVDVRAIKYFKETDFLGIPDDRLAYCLNQMEQTPDFVLLDSGGHLGNIEFNYLLTHLKSPCYIALDDINHVKHNRSFRQILKDPRFVLKLSSDEKFGFCIARFNPTTAGGPAAPRRILWLRTDSIGDSILSLPVLAKIKKKYPVSWISVLCQEHLAELYQGCRDIDEVLTFDIRRAQEDAIYRRVIVERLQELKADVCITPVYSRTDLTDLFALGSRAGERIAFAGDDSNISSSARELHNKYYTSVVLTADKQSEVKRYEMLVRALGYDHQEDLKPGMWISPDDQAFAERTFHNLGINPSETVVLFAGAQHLYRQSDVFGQALRTFCNHHGLSIISVGNALDRKISQRNLADVCCRVVDLTGQITIWQTASLIALSALAVGAETGPAHIAAAVGTPHVVLLGGGHFGRFMPYASTTTAVSLPLACFGCNWRCRYPQNYCITAISPEVIAYGLHQAMSSKSDRPRLVLQGRSYWETQPSLPIWDSTVVKSHDIPLSITLIEKGGDVSQLEQYPEAPMELQEIGPGGNFIISNRVDDVEYEAMLAYYWLEFKASPFNRMLFSLKHYRALDSQFADIVRGNLSYVKHWFQRKLR